MLSGLIRNGTLTPRTNGSNRLSSLFDRFFNDEFFVPQPSNTVWNAWNTLPLSLWEDENSVYLEADAPGLTENDIDISVQDGAVTIRGERKYEHKAEGYDNRSYGRFEHRIAERVPSGQRFFNRSVNRSGGSRRAC